MAMIEESATRDAAASVETAYTVSVGDEFKGVLSTNADEDWVAVELLAGRGYDIKLEGIGPEAVTDTVLRVFDANGKEVASNDDIEWEALELFSRVEFTPDESGVYYLSAAGHSGADLDNTGAYRITVFDEEDNTTDTPHTVAVGGAFRGTLDDKRDEDWIRVELVGGKTYDVTLRGIGADADTDTLLTIYNAAGERLARNDDLDLDGGRLDSKLTFTPEATGTYYLGAGAYTGGVGANAGRYQVAVHDTGVNYAVTLTGTESSEYYHTRLTGGIGDDVLDGNGGWDWLEGGPGADRITGGTGIDRASYQHSPAGVEVRLYDGTARGGDAEGDTFPGRQTIEQTQGADRAQEADATATGTDATGGTDGTAGVVSSSSAGPGGSSSSSGDAVAVTRAVEVPDIEDLFGSAHDDVLAGAAGPNWLGGYYGDDELDGREGDDWLDGGAGADALTGGPGLDAAVYLYSPEGVHVRLYDGTAKGGYAEGDTFPGRETVEYVNAAGEAQTVEEPDVEDLYGSFHNDILAGNHRANLLRGFDGNDRLDGREGPDVLEGGPGADALSGGPGEDTASYLYSPAGVVVRLHGGAARGGDAEGDTFPSRQTIEDAAAGEAGGRTSSPSPEVDVPDIEHLYGSAHNDVLAGDGRDNELSGAGGNDTLYGGPQGGDDLLNGGTGNDKLYGGKGADTLQGGAGADALYGGPGNDVLDGGPGNDTLDGRQGDDTFILAPGGGDDTLLDFGAGADKIDLTAFAGLQSTDDLVLQQQDGHLVIDLSAQGGGTATLQDVSQSAITDAHFIFHSADDPAIA